VHGGTSGIGVAAIQILKLFDAKILTTVGNEKKERFCRDLGVDCVFNYKKKDFFDEIKKLDLGGLDIILDYIGGEYINKNINLLRNDGKLINIGFQKGANVNLNLMKVMLKRLTITGSTLRIRNTSFKGKILKDIQKHIFPNFKNGKIKCYIDSVFEMNEIIKAHKRLDEGKHIGKIILKV
jgi:NADPH2:quinone reductase